MKKADEAGSSAEEDIKTSKKKRSPFLNRVKLVDSRLDASSSPGLLIKQTSNTSGLAQATCKFCLQAKIHPRKD